MCKDELRESKSGRSGCGGTKCQGKFKQPATLPREIAPTCTTKVIMESFQISKSLHSVKACCEVTDTSLAALSDSLAGQERSALLIRIRDTATTGPEIITCYGLCEIG